MNGWMDDGWMECGIGQFPHPLADTSPTFGGSPGAEFYATERERETARERQRGRGVESDGSSLEWSSSRRSATSSLSRVHSFQVQSSVRERDIEREKRERELKREAGDGRKQMIQESSGSISSTALWGEYAELGELGLSPHTHSSSPYVNATVLGESEKERERETERERDVSVVMVGIRQNYVGLPLSAISSPPSNHYEGLFFFFLTCLSFSLSSFARSLSAGLSLILLLFLSTSLSLYLSLFLSLSLTLNLSLSLFLSLCDRISYDSCHC